MPFRRIIQLLCLSLFLILLAWTAVTVSGDRHPSLFLRLDPALALMTVLSARILTVAFLPALAVMILGILGGRIFCGWICPMGTTLDGADQLVRVRATRRPPLQKIKYLVLCFLIGAAMIGVNDVFLAAPLSLITRFYGLVVYPVASLLAGALHQALTPLADHLGWYSFVFGAVKTPRFATSFFVLFFFGSLLGLAVWSPRFWCRYVCPAGALLALTSSRPLVRRRVSDECIECGKCVKACPMNAIPAADPAGTHFRECIVCQTCRDVCPVRAVTFGPAGSKGKPPESPALPERRQFVTAGLAGVGTALVGLTGLHTAYGPPGEGQVKPPLLLRPPGALPEPEFLRKCVRCGACLAACPTNTLQPIWFKAGWEALFSPALTPVRGYCDPKCRNCGQVCPTDAIRSLSPTERIWAKTGTAVINRQKCLAWEHGKACMVCDEVCRFDALSFRKTPESPAAVPYVLEDKCSGCGYCEHFCPVQNRKAIVVTPMGELRLSEGSYRQAARTQGLDLTLQSDPNAPYGPRTGYPEGMDLPNQPAPGFTESPLQDSGSGEPAPGFSESPLPEPAPGFTAPREDAPAPGFSEPPLPDAGPGSSESMEPDSTSKNRP